MCICYDIINEDTEDLQKHWWYPIVLVSLGIIFFPITLIFLSFALTALVFEGPAKVSKCKLWITCLCILPFTCMLYPYSCCKSCIISNCVNPTEIEHYAIPTDIENCENNNTKNHNDASYYNDDDEVYYNDYGVYHEDSGIRFV